LSYFSSTRIGRGRLVSVCCIALVICFSFRLVKDHQQQDSAQNAANQSAADGGSNR
jgi:hypothetical protein